MKRILLSVLVAGLFIFKAQSQNQFEGIRSSNYLGVKSVFFNPANIADNAYRWDANLFSVNAGVGDYNVSFNLHNLQSKMGNQTDSIMFGSKSKAASAYAGIDILGPGFMIALNKKTTFAFTTRARVMANIHDVDGKLINAIQSQNNSNLPFTLASAGNQSIALNGWTEFGGSLGRVLVEEGNHFLKGGITLKYLAGFSNGYIHLNNISGTVNSDVNGNYLTSAGGTVQLGEGGADLTNLKGSSLLQFKGSGAGADLGVVYEFRRTSATHYKLKFSLALLDIGSIHYHANPNYTAGYTVNVPNGQKFYLNNLKDSSSISSIKNYLDQSPYFQNISTANGSYGVGLPTTLVGSADMNVVSKFYLNLDTRLNLHGYNKFASPYYQNNFTLTPRYEGKYFGAYLPLNINSLTGFNAGVAFRMGPFFLGSGSVLTSLLGTSRQADFYFGVHIGGLRK
ncbi:MAG TPA: DUF5723 family protein [Puia sp.]|nr:DUF5723 family protein [Puia sp.]